MGMRLTAPEKWRDSWFRRLKPPQKLLWIWLLDQCDIAGTVDIDLELASIEIGATIKGLEGFESRLIHIKDTRYWIKGFIEFQQKCSVEKLNPANNAHLGILRIIEKYSLLNLSGRGLAGADEGLGSPIGKGKGKDTGKGTGNNDEKSNSSVDCPKVQKERFVAPTLAEVEAYMVSQMPAIAARCPGAEKMVWPKQEAPKFVGYWTQNDWKVKGKEMKSWRQTVYNWLIKAFQFKVKA